jgi:tetratricopeptide (TPR) repeat protein
VWQTLRNQLHPHGFELVTVGLDTLGDAGCRAFIEAARPEHPSLIDRHHVLADLFGVINIPSGVWIDEQGMIVRPAEAAPAPPQTAPAAPRLALPGKPPQRFVEIMAEAAKIKKDTEGYHDALRDWVAKGADSRFALSPQNVVERSRPRDDAKALGHAHFQLAAQLEIDGHHEAAIQHFREAHRLVPDSWTFRRQAWSLEKVGDDALARFWQGPDPAKPEAWPYEGDWLKDVREIGAENYSEPWRP